MSQFASSIRGQRLNLIKFLLFFYLPAGSLLRGKKSVKQKSIWSGLKGFTVEGCGLQEAESASLDQTSLVPRPKSPCGEGSGDIGTVSWLYGRVT